MIAALGININGLYTLVCGLGAALAGLAGMMAGPLVALQVGMGECILILTFVVIVIGGLGNSRCAVCVSAYRGAVLYPPVYPHDDLCHGGL